MSKKNLKGFRICGGNLLSKDSVSNLNIKSCLGDIETNPGPFWKRGEDPIDNLQNIIDDQADELKDLKDTIDEQNDTIEDLRAKISDLADKFSELSDIEKTNSENALKCERMIESVQKESDRNFEKFAENDSKLGRELLQQKVTNIFDNECFLSRQTVT